MNKIFLLVFLSSTAFATTNIKVETTPVAGATITCDGTKYGITPGRFTLEDGIYHCTLSHKLTETINFELKVEDDEQIRVSMILIPGTMTKEQKEVLIHRTPRDPKEVRPVVQDYSAEAEQYILTKRGAEAQRLIQKLVQLRSPASDGGSRVSVSELADLKRSPEGPRGP